MQLILDNLLASIIASTIFLILVSLSFRGQEQAADAANNYALKKQELNFIEVLRQDLHSAIRVKTATSPPDSSFVFIRQSDQHGATDSVTYRRKYVTSRNGRKLYQIERLSGVAYSGASMATVTDWQIEAQNKHGNAVHPDTLDKATQIFVRFEAAAPFKEDSIVTLSRWEATFHPPLLREAEL